MNFVSLGVQSPVVVGLGCFDNCILSRDEFVDTKKRFRLGCRFGWRRHPIVLHAGRHPIVLHAGPFPMHNAVVMHWDASLDHPPKVTIGCEIVR